MSCSVAQLIHVLVIEIGNWKGSKVNIIVGRSRPVDYDSSDNAVAILSREVRVVPCGTVLSGTESIDSAASFWFNWAFGDSINTNRSISTRFGAEANSSYPSMIFEFFWTKPCQWILVLYPC